MALFDRVVESVSALGRDVDQRLPRSPFGRLGVVHAGGSAADALVSVALAGSLFFSLEPGAAKSKVLQYLLISLAPFVVVAPFIGPLVDRLGHARRWVLFGSLIARAFVCLLMAGKLDSLLLFPYAFAVLVSAKTASVARNALVPSVVPSDNELVRANARLSLISVVGAAIVLPFGFALRKYADDGWVLRLASLIFAVSAFLALRVKSRKSRVAIHDDEGSDPRIVLADTAVVRVNGLAMALLRGAVGCVMFVSLFSLRDEPLWVTGLTLGSLTGGTSIGAALAERLRRKTTEERMILVSMGLVGVVSVGTTLFRGVVGGVILAAVLGVCASASRLAFDAIVQRSLRPNDFGGAFARYETRFQLAWVIGALAPTAVDLPRSLGFAFVSLAMLFGVVVALVGEPALDWLAEKLRWMTGQLRVCARRITGGKVLRGPSRKSVRFTPGAEAVVEASQNGTDTDRNCVHQNEPSLKGPLLEKPSFEKPSFEKSSHEYPLPEGSLPQVPFRLPRMSTVPRSKSRGISSRRPK